MLFTDYTISPHSLPSTSRTSVMEGGVNSQKHIGVHELHELLDASIDKTPEIHINPTADRAVEQLPTGTENKSPLDISVTDRDVLMPQSDAVNPTVKFIHDHHLHGILIGAFTSVGLSYFKVSLPVNFLASVGVGFGTYKMMSNGIKPSPKPEEN